MRTLDEVIAFMRAAHIGQVDKAGIAYWRHPMRVMARLVAYRPGDRETWRAEAEYRAALLHDVVEDTAVTLDDLRRLNAGEDVVTLVDLLTKRKGQTNAAYIGRLIDSRNISAMRVKLADCYDNASPRRVHALPYNQQQYLSHKLAEVSAALKNELGTFNYEDIIEGDF